MKSEPRPRTGITNASTSAASAPPPPFRALHQLIDDVEALTVRHGSVQQASARLERLESEVVALEDEVTLLKQKLEAAAKETLTPLQAVEVLQRRCTCVGDVAILGTLLAASLRSAGAEGVGVGGETDDVRVILSVHEVNLGASTAASASTTTDRVPGSSSGLAQASVSIAVATGTSRQAGRPLKRQRRESSTEEAVIGAKVADNQVSEVCDENQQEGVISVDDSDAELHQVVMETPAADSTPEAPASLSATTSSEIDTSTKSSSTAGVIAATAATSVESEAVSSTDAVPRTGPAVPPAITHPKEPGRVESRVSANGVITRNWKLPRAIIRSINSSRRSWPELTMESFQQLDAARPWDLVFFRRSNVSYVFHYRLLKSKGKRWVRAARWFQFQFRRELWEWMHWIRMDERRDYLEWELYRRSRDERIVSMLTAWWKLHDDAMGLIADKVLPADVWLDPSIWFLRPEQRLIWKLATENLVQEQAEEDLRHHVRCYFVSRRHDHPFFGSEFQSVYPEKHNLPLLISADRLLEVQIAPPSSIPNDAAPASIPCPTPWGTTEEAPRYRVVRHHRRPRDAPVHTQPPPPEAADFSA
jgi:hypothetical protein